jgi:hypothetical protein
MTEHDLDPSQAFIRSLRDEFPDRFTNPADAPSQSAPDQTFLTPGAGQPRRRGTIDAAKLMELPADNLTPAAAAKQLGVQPSSVYRWPERHDRPLTGSPVGVSAAPTQHAGLPVGAEPEKTPDAEGPADPKTPEHPENPAPKKRAVTIRRKAPAKRAGAEALCNPLAGAARKTLRKRSRI